MPRRELTREQALASNPNWSHTDRKILEGHMDRLGAITFYRTKSGGYTGCEGPDGKRVMFIHPGYVKFAKGLAPVDRPNQDWDGIDLSTARWKSPAQRISTAREVYCPIHGMPILPAVGCEDCN